MDKLTEIIGALGVIAAIVATSAFADQLGPNANDKPAEGMQLSRGELSDVPVHRTAPGTRDDFNPPPERVLPTDKVGREGKALPSKIGWILPLRCGAHGLPKEGTEHIVAADKPGSRCPLFG